LVNLTPGFVKEFQPTWQLCQQTHLNWICSPIYFNPNWSQSSVNYWIDIVTIAKPQKMSIWFYWVLCSLFAKINFHVNFDRFWSLQHFWGNWVIERNLVMSKIKQFTNMISLSKLAIYIVHVYTKSIIKVPFGLKIFR